MSLVRKAWMRSIIEARTVGKVDVILIMMGFEDSGEALERMVSTFWR